jgi:hypothetical protein
MRTHLITIVLGLGVAGVAGACTSLGPMPATTGVSAVTHGKPGVELSGAITPVWRLSAAASGEDRSGNAVLQGAIVVEPDRLIDAPGLVVGARAFGNDGDAGYEPLVGYRHRANERTTIAAVAYGTKMSAAEHGADYEAVRAGAEIVADAEVVKLASWLALHASASASGTYVSASGRYCVDPDGDAIDCDADGPNTMTDGEVRGVYPTGSASLALDLVRRGGGFRGVRLAFAAAGGYMPRLVGGEQRRGDLFGSAGLSLTVAFGDSRDGR